MAENGVDEIDKNNEPNITASIGSRSMSIVDGPTLDPDKIGELIQYCLKDYLENDPGTSTSHIVSNTHYDMANYEAEFTIYQPQLFERIRTLNGVDRKAFSSAICNRKFKPFANTGSSKSLFFSTVDNTFLLKTMDVHEKNKLLALLEDLVESQMRKTLLCKFLCAFTLKSRGKTIHMCIMNNLFLWAPIGMKYDLKGSFYHRFVKEKTNGKPSTLRCQNFVKDFPQGIKISPEGLKTLEETLQKDCEILKKFDIMDYSLLIGIIYVDDLLSKNKDCNFRIMKSYSSLISNEGSSSDETQFSDVIKTDSKNSKIYNIPSGAVLAVANGKRVIVMLQIIDVLIKYGTRKKLEMFSKFMLKEVSVKPPKAYSSRFLKFITETVFRPNKDDKWKEWLQMHSWGELGLNKVNDYLRFLKNNK